MLSRRHFLLSSLAATVATPVLFSQQPTELSIHEAGRQLVDALSSSTREKVLLPFDHAEKFNWDFVPLNDTSKRISTRKGISLDDCTREARTAVLALLRSSVSQQGYEWCKAIMEREAILAELEPRNAWFRKPGWYFVTLYGQPARTGVWAWRLDGHHLSVSCTVKDGELISASPFFMGVNPVTIMHGPKKGTRDTITPAEDVARELYLALTPDQQKLALHQEHLPEVKARTRQAPTLPTGLSVARMDTRQQSVLQKLLQHYFERMPQALVASEKKKLDQSGLDRLSFTYTGEAAAGKRHTYVIQGPTLFVHYMNEQTDPHRNPANHIHSVYRSVSNDFGAAAIRG